jgi:hypothetical protein
MRSDEDIKKRTRLRREQSALTLRSEAIARYGSISRPVAALITASVRVAAPSFARALSM